MKDDLLLEDASFDWMPEIADELAAMAGESTPLKRKSTYKAATYKGVIAQDRFRFSDALALKGSETLRVLFERNYRHSVLAFTDFPILRTGGRGLYRFNCNICEMVPSLGQNGSLYFLHTTDNDVPNLLAAFVPNNINFSEAISTVVFITPPPTAFHQRTAYPFGESWIQIFDNYLVGGGKRLLSQLCCAGAQCVFLLPLGKPLLYMHGLIFAHRMRRYVSDALSWLRWTRTKQNTHPPRLGPCALASFSRSATLLTPLMQSSLRGEFPEFSEIYAFDPVGPHPSQFLDMYTQWQRRPGRRIRVYSQYDSWRNAWRQMAQNSRPVHISLNKNDGAEEYMGFYESFLFAPKQPFWNLVEREEVGSNVCRYNMSDIHQLFPCLFFEHALRNSQMPKSKCA